MQMYHKKQNKVVNVFIKTILIQINKFEYMEIVRGNVSVICF